MPKREKELEERLITIYQMLRAYQLEAAKGMMTHAYRSYRIEHILGTMQTWRTSDEANRPVLAQLPQVVSDEIPF
jgi:hypothetical protein